MLLNTRNIVILGPIMLIIIFHSCKTAKNVEHGVYTDERKLIDVLDKVKDSLTHNETFNVVFLKSAINGLGTYLIEGQKIFIIRINFEMSGTPGIRSEFIDDEFTKTKMIAFINDLKMTDFQEVPSKYVNIDCDGCRSVIHYTCIIQEGRAKRLTQNLLLNSGF